jgi:hypothetical protein
MTKTFSVITSLIFIFSVFNSYASSNAFYSKPSYTTFYENGFISKFKASSTWDDNKKMIILNFVGEVKRPWKEVRKYLDPINWANCSGYFRGSQILSKSPSNAEAGTSWSGELNLVENILADVTNMPKGALGI